MKLCFVVILMLSGILLNGQKKGVFDVGDAVESLRKLMIDPDSLQLSNILDNDLSYGHSSGKIDTKSEFISNLVNGNSDFEEITFSNEKIFNTGKTAIVRHNLTVKTYDKGVPGNLKLHVLTVWVKNKKNWRLLARQATRLNP